MSNIKRGYYVEVGSNDPIKFSNTFKLYLSGWKGIIIDGNYELIEESKKIRKEDVCICAVVSNKIENLDFFISEDTNYSSINLSRASMGPNILSSRRVQTVTLDSLMEKYLPENQAINVLSIDVEGHDFEVLCSISLDKYKPDLIIVEDLSRNSSDLQNNIFLLYLKKYNYILVGTDTQNLYFLKIK